MSVATWQVVCRFIHTAPGRDGPALCMAHEPRAADIWGGQARQGKRAAPRPATALGGPFPSVLILQCRPGTRARRPQSTRAATTIRPPTMNGYNPTPEQRACAAVATHPLARLEGIWFVCRTCELATAIVGAATGAGVMPQAFEPCAGNRAATSARALFFSFARAHWLAMTSERPRPQWQRPHGGVAPRIIFMCQAGLGGAGCSAQGTTGAPNKRLGD